MLELDQTVLKWARFLEERPQSCSARAVTDTNTMSLFWGLYRAAVSSSACRTRHGRLLMAVGAPLVKLQGVELRRKRLPCY